MNIKIKILERFIGRQKDLQDLLAYLFQKITCFTEFIVYLDLDINYHTCRPTGFIKQYPQRLNIALSYTFFLELFFTIIKLRITRYKVSGCDIVARVSRIARKHSDNRAEQYRQLSISSLVLKDKSGSGFYGKTRGKIGLFDDTLSYAAACDSSATNTVVSFFSLFQVSTAAGAISHSEQ